MHRHTENFLMASFDRSPDEQELVIYPSRFRAALLAALMLAGSALGLALIIFREQVPLKMALAGFLVTPLAGAALGLAIVRLALRRPLIVANAVGIYDNFSGFSPAWIYWPEVLSVDVYKTARGKHLGIIVRDPEIVLARRDALTRVGLRMTLAQGYPTPFFIPTLVVAEPLEEIRDHLREVQRQHCHNDTLDRLNPI
jgi:hypothetical protein